MLVSSVIDTIMFSNFNCIWLLFSLLGLDLKLSCNRNAEWTLDPPIWNAAGPVGAVMRTIDRSSSGFTVCLEKWDMSLFYKTYNMTFPCPTWATKKNSVSFLHYYMALIFIQGPYMSAIVLKIHVLFSKSCRSKSNATQSSLNLFAFSCIISCSLMYDLW